jgi:hypothetical protein
MVITKEILLGVDFILILILCLNKNFLRKNDKFVNSLQQMFQNPTINVSETGDACWKVTGFRGIFEHLL